MPSVKELVSQLLNKTEQTKQESQIYTYLVATEEKQHFAIPIEYIVEVFEITPDNPLIPLPLVSDYIRGIINVRGEIIPVLSLNTMLQIDCHHEKTRFVVIINHEFKLGLAVHQVSDLYQVDTSKLKPIQHLQEQRIGDLISAEFDFEESCAQVLNVIGLYESSFVK